MLPIPSALEGKRAYYGDFHKELAADGFHLCGGWEYSHAYLDASLYSQDGVTIYLRLPIHTISGELDREDALVEFDRPFLVKHVVYTGFAVEDDDFSALDVTGLNQFQPPRDPDDLIEQTDKWRQIGEQAIGKVLPYVN